MVCNIVPPTWKSLCRASVAGLVLSIFFVGCGSQDGLGPSTDIPAIAGAPQDSAGTADSVAAPTDSVAAPTDSVAAPTDSVAAPTDSAVPDSTLPSDSSSTASPAIASTAPGIVFGTFTLPTSLLGSVHTGTLVGGDISPSNALTLLSATRSRGGRIVVKLCMGRDDFVKNADGTFSFTKWKALVDRFRTVNLGPYIADGTILGHYLIDEPHRAAKWGGKSIPQATLEAMAKYSKQIWPGMTTMVRVVPSWLASASVTYTHLDAAWLQYEAWRGDVSKVVTAEVAAAKRKGLGLVVGLNALDGGNGSSRIAGWSKGKYAMSASEMRSYGSALLSQSYSCGFYNWMYGSSYYSRTDIKSAMSELSTKARNHVKTSCRQ